MAGKKRKFTATDITSSTEDNQGGLCPMKIPSEEEGQPKRHRLKLKSNATMQTEGNQGGLCPMKVPSEEEGQPKRHRLKLKSNATMQTEQTEIVNFMAVPFLQNGPVQIEAQVDPRYCTHCHERSIVMTEEEFVCRSCGLVKGQIFVHTDGSEPQHPSLFLP